MGLTEIIRRAALRATPFLAAASWACTDIVSTAPKPTSSSQPTQPEQPPRPSTIPLPDGSFLINIRVYNGTDSTFNLVHPSVLMLDDTTWILAASTDDSRGADKGNGLVENTVLLFSKDGKTFYASPNTPNPFMNADSVNNNYFLSDPEQVLVGQRKVMVTSRMPTRDHDIILAKMLDSSKNAPYMVILEAPKNGAIAPTILMNGGGADMLSVDAGPTGCKSNKNYVVLRHSESVYDFNNAKSDTTDLQIPGYEPWHQVMTRGPKTTTDSSFIVLVAAYPPNPSKPEIDKCSHTDVLFALTRDKKHYTVYSTPIKKRGDNEFLSMTAYRVGAVYDQPTNTLRIYYSGFSAKGTRIMVQDYNYNSMLASLKQGIQPAPTKTTFLNTTATIDNLIIRTSVGTFTP